MTCVLAFDAGRPGPIGGVGPCHQEAPRRLVNHRHLPIANRFIAMLHASGAASTLQRRGIPHTRPSCGCASVPPDPTQLLQKAHSCDRHHIASAMAELIFCLSIIPHVRSFDVPPKLSPAQRGAFFAPLELKGGTRLALLRRRRDRRADDSRRLGLPASLDDTRSLGRAARGAPPSRACPSNGGCAPIPGAAPASLKKAKAVRRSMLRSLGTSAGHGRPAPSSICTRRPSSLTVAINTCLAHEHERVQMAETKPAPFDYLTPGFNDFNRLAAVLASESSQGAGK
jgi:hypothetical protein